MSLLYENVDILPKCSQFIKMSYIIMSSYFTSGLSPHKDREQENAHALSLSHMVSLTNTHINTLSEMQREMMSVIGSLLVDTVLLVFRDCVELTNLRGQMLENLLGPWEDTERKMRQRGFDQK